MLPFWENEEGDEVREDDHATTAGDKELTSGTQQGKPAILIG